MATRPPGGSVQSDSDLVRHTLDGDHGCFRTLIERYKDAVFGVALSRCGSHADAEDIAQESFIAAYDTLGSLRCRAKFGSWLRGIAVKKAAMHMRLKQRRHQRVHDSRTGQRSDCPVQAPDEHIGREEERSIALAALRKLPPRDRETATLYYINGYTQAEVGRFLDCPVGTVKSRLHKARRRLRKEMLRMVEEGLKGIALQTGFTDQVLARIQGARVQVGKPPSNHLLLTDERRRSFAIGISGQDACALAPLYDAGFEALDPLDLRAVLVRVLTRFGCRISEAAVHELRGCEFRCTLQVRGLDGDRCVSCRIYEAMHLAFASRAPLFVAEELADGLAIRRKDGKPCTPRGAWRHIQRQAREQRARDERVFPTLDAVFEALENDSDDREARNALRQAPWTDRSGLPERLCTLRDRTDGVQIVLAWEARCRDTAQAQLAAALTGAMLLWSAQDPEAAIPYLERAYKLDPRATDCASNLATAYVRTERREEAISLLRGCPQIHQWAREFGNLRDLWADPRFTAICGPPEIENAHIIDVCEFHEFVYGKVEESQPEQTVVVELTQPTEKDAEAACYAGVGVEGVPALKLHIPPGGREEPEQIEIELVGGQRIPVRCGGWNEDDVLWRGLGLYTVPDRSQAMCVVQVLRAAGIAAQYVLLRKTPSGDMSGELVMRGNDRVEHVHGRATDLIAVAVRGDLPIWVAGGVIP